MTRINYSRFKSWQQLIDGNGGNIGSRFNFADPVNPLSQGQLDQALSNIWRTAIRVGELQPAYYTVTLDGLITRDFGVLDVSPFWTARIEWGVNSFEHEAFVDVRQGLPIQLFASSISVSVRATETGLDGRSGVSGFVGAQLAPGNRPSWDVPPRATLLVGQLLAAGVSAAFPIPPFANRVSVSGFANGGGAVTGGNPLIHQQDVGGDLVASSTVGQTSPVNGAIHPAATRIVLDNTAGAVNFDKLWLNFDLSL